MKATDFGNMRWTTLDSSPKMCLHATKIEFFSMIFGIFVVVYVAQANKRILGLEYPRKKEGKKDREKICKVTQSPFRSTKNENPEQNFQTHFKIASKMWQKS